MLERPSSRLWLGAIVAIAAFFAAGAFDFAEQWNAFAQRAEGFELDELPLIGLTVGGIALWLALRRSRNASLELELTRAREREAKRATELEELRGEVQKREAIEIFAAGLAHDFGNLLFAIDGFAAQAESRKPGALGDAVTGLRQATAQGRSLVANVRQLAEPAPIDTRPVAINDLLRGMSSVLGGMAGDGIRVEVVEGDVPRVRGDASALTQIVVNLAKNACDAMPEGGGLRLETSRVDLEGEPRVRLRIEDQGAGMDPATVARAFDPFFTTKAPQDGTGLGLTMVRILAAQLGGSIEIDSAPGEGTCCDLLLQIAETED